MFNTQELYTLKSSNLVCIDIETYDPDIKDKGPGTHRGQGHICGLGVATYDNEGKLINDYLSFSHPDTPPELRAQNMRQAKDILSWQMPKIGANIVYDIEWLQSQGFEVNGKYHDVQYAEPLLDEYRRSYSLKSLAEKYYLKAKQSSVLDRYAATMGWKGKGIEHIWRMPEKVAREYALVDVELPLDIFAKQQIELEKQNLWDLYLLETDLIPVILEMRKHGVRLDIPLLKKTIKQATEVLYNLKDEIRDWAGYDININSPKQLAERFDKEGINFPRNPLTANMKAKGIKLGNPNLNKQVLNKLAQSHPICQKILDYRHYDTLINMFLHRYATDNVDGRLYCTFHPLRSDNYGTVSGRFSSSNPNLQQVSAKKEENVDGDLDALKGQVVRKLFIPDEGHRWAKADYSQVEYRIMAHYAQGKGSDELRESYNNNKHMDYHQRIVELTGFDRRDAKRVNFGGAYGIGVATASNLFGWSLDEAEIFMNAYHRAAPYIKSTRWKVSEVAARRRHIYTILNRKARVHPSRKLHSMFNRLIQGSAADIMKQAMVDAYKKGLFEELRLHLTVHDEVDVSYKDNKTGNEALVELVSTMEDAVKLKVPLLVDCHTGENWAEAD